MFSITSKAFGILTAAALLSACSVLPSSPVVISLAEPEFVPGPVLPAVQPFPPGVNAALPDGIPASAVRVQDGCYFYRFGDEIRPVSFDGTNPICITA